MRNEVRFSDARVHKIFLGEKDYLAEKQFCTWLVGHPNIVPFLGADDQTLTIFLERGMGDVFDLALQGVDVVLCATHVACALAWMHMFGLVHMDVKPENVVRLRSGRFCLIDFEFVSPKGVHHPTLRGTHDYIDPFYAQTHMTCTSIDVFAFGVTLLNLLAKRMMREACVDTRVQLALVRDAPTAAQLLGLAFPSMEYRVVAVCIGALPSQRETMSNVLTMCLEWTTCDGAREVGGGGGRARDVKGGEGRGDAEEEEGGRRGCGVTACVPL